MSATYRSTSIPSLDQERGFTLLEVMIAMSIFAIIGLASYQLLSGEIRTQQRLKQHAELQDNWQRSMMRLSRDLQQIVARGVRENYGEFEAPLISDGQSLHLTRQGWSNPLERQRSELQRVEYSLQLIDTPTFKYEQKSNRGSGAQSVVRRKFWPQLDRAPGSAAIEQSLFTGINDLRFRFFDEDTRQWITQWPPNDEASLTLPQAIEVTISDDRYGDLQRLVNLTPSTDDMIKGNGR